MEFLCRLHTFNTNLFFYFPYQLFCSVTDLETIQRIQIIATLSLECCKQLKDSDCVLPDDLPSN